MSIMSDAVKGTTSKKLLELKDVTVYTSDGRKLLDKVNLELNEGEVILLFGPNGVGKSSLLASIMGVGGYKVEGDIIFKGKRINDLSPDERAKLGIGLAFQKSPQFKGLKLADLLKKLAEMYNVPEDELNRLIKELRMDYLLERDVNRGFSGGETKRTELLALALQKPQLSLIDEPDSGVDVDAIRSIAETINLILERDERIKDRKRSAIIITHSGLILEHVSADKGYILLDGKIVCSANPMEIFKNIREHGYARCKTCYN